MKKLNRKQKRNILLVFAFILLGTAMLAVGVRHSDDIQTKWDEITEKFESDDEEKENETEDNDSNEQEEQA